MYVFENCNFLNASSSDVIAGETTKPVKGHVKSASLSSSGSEPPPADPVRSR